jgi:hypothetical protein
MSEAKKNKLFRPSTVALAEWKYRSAADAAERDQVLLHLQDALHKYTDDRSINWYAHEVELQPGSSLHEIYNPGVLLLKEVLNTGPVIGAIAREDASDHHGLVRITSQGVMEVRAVRGWVDLGAAQHFEFSQPTRSTIKLIADIAAVAGGYVWPDLDVPLDQWFRFHEIDLPDTKAKIINLIALFKFSPEVKEPVNYWEHFRAVDQGGLGGLSEEQLMEVRDTTEKIMPKRKLLSALYNLTGKADITYETAAQRLVEFVEHPISLNLARSYIKELNWYGVGEGQTVSENILRQLLMTAILLDLDPSIGHRHLINRRDLYSPDNVERHPMEVLDEYTAFVRSKRWADPVLAPLVAHLLLARNAPEFLVREIPPTVRIGSIAWINLCRAVVLVEAVKTGASRELTYAQIIAYGELKPVSDAQKHMRDLALIDPIVDWALVNAIVTKGELEQSEEAATRRAIDAFEQHSEQFVQIARAFSTPLPNRADIARAQLQVAAPGCDTLDEKALSEKGGQQVMSMVDLHQSGDMVTRLWDRRTVRLIINGLPRQINYNPSGISLYSLYPKLRTIESCDAEMDRQLGVHFNELNSAMKSAVKLALAQMPEGDLLTFMNSQIHFFTVRESSTYIRTRPLSGPVDIGLEYETLQSRDAATGRFGIVMYASYESADVCYELFTSRAEMRKNDALAQFIKRERKLQQRSRMSASADLTYPLSITRTQSLPLNVKRYTHAAAEDASITSSMAIIDYFGALEAPQVPAAMKQGFYQKFNDPNIARIAGFLAQNRPFLNKSELRELVRIPTPLELSKEEGERLLTYFIDLLVPFKRCIEDIASGEHNKMVDGFYGCLMDGIGLVGTVAGAGSKALSISAKAISTTAKAARFTRLAFTSAISLFNPFDGVPTGLQSGGKLVHKGLLRFNKNSHDLIVKASGQLRKISGRRHSYDLLEAADNAQVGLGNWRPRGTTDAIAVLAARKGDKWYALNRRGNLWGKPLDGFAYRAPVQLPYSPRTLPVSYTQEFIERSLPRARAKVDNAIEVFNQHEFKRDRESLMKIVFGSTSQVSTDRLVNYLRLIRFDFAGFSLSNMILDGVKITDTLASFDVNNYKRWKESDSDDESDIAFVEVYTRNLNKHFVSMGFNHDVVADDLIHELFHASAQTDDVGYAIDAVHRSDDGQRLDVRELLNLGAGCLPTSDTTTTCHAPSRAFENADSLALATSLLSQLATDKATFDQNMTILRGALDASAGKAIAEPIVITLNKPR